MNEHTKSPWGVTPNMNEPPDTFFIDYGKRRKRHICFITSNGRQKVGEVIANAHLVSASPNLFAACEYGGTAKEKENVLDYAADLIESLIPQDNSGNWEVAHTLREKARMEREAIAKAKGETK